MAIPVHPRLGLWMEIGDMLAELTQMAAKQALKSLKPKRRGGYKTRRPGGDTPFWNACAVLLRDELRQHGSKVRLARYLGIPKQRLNDYLKATCRMPDAETALEMLNWLAQKREGRDLSL